MRNTRLKHNSIKGGSRKEPCSGADLSALHFIQSHGCGNPRQIRGKNMGYNRKYGPGEQSS